MIRPPLRLTTLAYAFLLKELQFENAFEDFRHPITFYGRRGALHVEAFGIDHYTDQRHRKLRDQVDIIDYRDQHDFIIRLTPKAGDDEIILARVKPERTLLETFERVSERIVDSGRNSTSERLSENDILQIPKFELSIDHTYSSLLGLHLLSPLFLTLLLMILRLLLCFLHLDNLMTQQFQEYIFQIIPFFLLLIVFFFVLLDIFLIFLRSLVLLV